MGTTGGKNNFWRGWDLYLDDQNFINLRLVSALPGNLIHIKSKDSILKNNWTHLSFSYDGLGKADGTNLFVNGSKIKNLLIRMQWYFHVPSKTLICNIKKPLLDEEGNKMGAPQGHRTHSTALCKR